jgi:hypothetical protein
MIWESRRWVWRLEAPLFIGMPPSESLNRCRLYVPARTIWGAVTAELARSEGDAFPDYPGIGERIREHCRFTYFYPAEESNGEYRAWLPKFVEAKGMLWRREDFADGNDQWSKSDREFRRCLLHARPATAIDPDSDSAAEGTLRETECLLPRWRDGHGNGGVSTPVYLAGYVLAKDREILRSLESRDILFLGGDTRYGLGKVRRVSMETGDGVFGMEMDSTDDDPIVKGDRTLAHALAENGSGAEGIRGISEMSGGWNRGKALEKRIAWAPGSAFSQSRFWRIGRDGFWVASETS